MKEQNLIQSCKGSSGSKMGYCSIHGPGANRLPISLNLDTTTIEQSNSIKLLNYKFAAIYWSMYKDMDYIESKMKKAEYAMGEQRLRVLQMNTENLFEIQKHLVALLEISDNLAEVEKSWRHYSEDTEAVAKQLLALGDTLMQSSTPTANSTNNKQGSRELALDVIAASGDLYEQVGYAYSQGERHKLAAQSWKQAANISSLLLSQAEKRNRADDAEYHRYLAATRLHRASYNWALSIDQESAKTALAESQSFVNDGESIEGLVEQAPVASNY